jgi:hypothetical protein
MASAARLIGESGITFELGPGTVSIGRPDQASGWSPAIDLTAIDRNRKSSRRHAELRVAPGSILLRDLGSANRTFVNGQPLEPQREYPLSEGDVVTFGDVVLRVQGLAPPETGLRCPKCHEPVTADMAICASCGANLRNETMTISVGKASACFRCGRPTRTGEHCDDCTAAIAEADAELLALSSLKRKK